MSKSLGNTQDPLKFVEGGNDQKKEPAYGADVLRLWVSSVDFQGDVSIGPNIIAQVCLSSRIKPSSLQGAKREVQGLCLHFHEIMER